MSDREKVISGLEEIANDKWMKIHADWYVSVCSDALALLKEQPDIVMCKDCIHQDPDRFNDGSDRYVCRKGRGWKPDDWFCADGERR